MHSAAPSCACASASSSDSMTPRRATPHASSIPVSMRHGHDDTTTFVNANAPQCCHCGCRGYHSATCPFK
ncbi:hypothetical protein OG21DRAFT_1513197 [Imleria badia]|nr:hypothetical protein OG21DRAFT_1513197 [Imleria badia]